MDNGDGPGTPSFASFGHHFVETFAMTYSSVEGDFEDDETSSFLTPNNSMQGEDGLTLTDTDFFYNDAEGQSQIDFQHQHQHQHQHQPPSSPFFHHQHHQHHQEDPFSFPSSSSSSSSSMHVAKEEPQTFAIPNTPMMDQEDVQNTSHPTASSSSSSSSFAPHPHSQSGAGEETSSASGATESTAEILNQLFEDLNRQKEFLEKYREVVRTALLKPHLNLADQKMLRVDQEMAQFVAKLQVQIAEILAELKRRQEIIDQLESFYILLVDDLIRIDFLRSNFSLLLAQTELYASELSFLQKPSSLQKPLATLFIIQQPFPVVTSKLQSFHEGDLVVKLLTAATVRIHTCDNVEATVVADGQLKGTEGKIISNNVSSFNFATMEAHFPLKFCEGTRKAAVHLRFSAKIVLEQLSQIVSGSLESSNSSPFVVMTNQKQWEACERTLVLRDSFRGFLEVTWPQFANGLQRQFVRTIKKDTLKMVRLLSVFDLNFLYRKFFSSERSEIVRQDNFDQFWDWYGKCVQVIRYQRHISHMWNSGLFYGFITREEVNMVLSSHPPGSFIIRFSERHPGQFGIAYVHQIDNTSTQIRHYLVSPTDTAAAKVTLPDFMRDKQQFLYLLQYSMLSNGPNFQPILKRNALEQFYSGPRRGDSSGSGYDPLED